MLKITGLLSAAVKFKFDEGTTLGQLVSRLEEEDSSLKTRSFSLQMGFPPRDVEGDASTALSSLVSSGESLVVRKTEGEIQKHPIRKQDVKSNSESFGQMARHIIAADNSCLFNAIGFCLNGQLMSDAPIIYRSYIAEEVVANKSGLYSEAFLGKSAEAYAEWVQNPEHWGGEIEMHILSQFLDITICAVDVQTGVVYKYSPPVVATATTPAGAKETIFLIYDGIHYDAMVRRKSDGLEGLQTSFSEKEESQALAECETAAKRLREERQFTDTKNFDLRCLVCNVGLVGEAGAREHAKLTGHQNFGEYTSNCTATVD